MSSLLQPPSGVVFDGWFSAPIPSKSLEPAKIYDELLAKVLAEDPAALSGLLPSTVTDEPGGNGTPGVAA